MRNYSRKFRRSRQRGGVLGIGESKEDKLKSIADQIAKLQEQQTQIESGQEPPSLLSSLPSLPKLPFGLGSSTEAPTQEPPTTPRDTPMNGGRRRSRRRRSRRRR